MTCYFVMSIASSRGTGGRSAMTEEAMTQKLEGMVAPAKILASRIWLGILTWFGQSGKDNMEEPWSNGTLPCSRCVKWINRKYCRRSTETERCHVTWLAPTSTIHSIGRRFSGTWALRPPSLRDKASSSPEIINAGDSWPISRSWLGLQNCRTTWRHQYSLKIARFAEDYHTSVAFVGSVGTRQGLHSPWWP